MSLSASSAVFTAPGTLILTAAASDPSGIRQVNFYQGTTLIHTDQVRPYETSVDIQDVSRNGAYTFRAEAVDTAGNKANNSVVVTVGAGTGPGNDTIPPQATMIVNQLKFTSPGELKLQVTASDASGIASVQFYEEERLLYETTDEPYETTIQIRDASQNGEHTYRAWVMDTQGNAAEVKTTIAVELPGEVTSPDFDVAMFQKDWEWGVSHERNDFGGNVTWTGSAQQGTVTTVSGTHGPDCFANTVQPCGGEVTVHYDSASKTLRVDLRANVEICGPGGGSDPDCTQGYTTWLDGTDSDGKVTRVDGQLTIEGQATLAVRRSPTGNSFFLRQKP
ncbi:Ig-like domain-containing protein [Deinococcus peraridilitoris]|uniref:Ig-like domain-containing protein n=1 Tax=Deinococcus peraridilitoris TaxID=432329 RepID=UPI0012F9943D|nr:Ig-like domain-containing protein [Deinococcus peraridilitoris]